MLPWRGSSACCWCVGLPCHDAALLAMVLVLWCGLAVLLALLPPPPPPATQTLLASPLLACPPSPQVCGSWQGVAAALQHQPALLFAGDEAVEGLLPEPAQQATWRVVAAMEGSG